MKKYLKFTFLLLLMLFAPVVYANGEQEGDNGGNASWPKSFEHGDFKYSIEGFIVNVYEINEDSGIVSQAVITDTGTVTVSMTIDEKSYADEDPTRSFPLSEEDFTINPSYKADGLTDVDTLFVDLDLSLTKEKLKELLAEEMGSVTSTKSFLIDICVQFRFAQVPSRFNYAYRFDVPRILEYSVLMTEMPEIDINEVNTIVFNRAAIALNDENEAELYYTETIDSDNAISFMNYIGFSSEKLEKADDVPEFLVMFHNADNIEYLFSDDIESPLTAGDASKEVVKVVDTSKNISVYIYLGSIILILIGISMVLLVLYQKEMRE